jgi:hypothetical protein
MTENTVKDGTAKLLGNNVQIKKMQVKGPLTKIIEIALTR